MRITQSMMSQQVVSDVQGNLQRLSKLQNEISTGKRINSPDDDPIGASFVMRYKAALSHYQQYSDNAGAAKGYLDNADSTMNQAVQVMQSARQVAVQASNDSMNPQDRQGLAASVDQLYQQLVTIGNSQYQGKYIFNGQMTATVPYSVGTAETATTDDGLVLYDLGDGVHLNVNVTGSDFFGAADSAPVTTNDPTDTSDNAFTVLAQLKAALNDPNTKGQDIGNLLGKFDSRIQTMLTMRADVGARTNRVTMAQTRLDDLTTNTKALLSNTQDLDVTQAIVDLKTAENVHQSSLQVGARVLMPTLLDFLK